MKVTTKFMNEDYGTIGRKEDLFEELGIEELKTEELFENKPINTVKDKLKEKIEKYLSENSEIQVLNPDDSLKTVKTEYIKHVDVRTGQVSVYTKEIM